MLYYDFLVTMHLLFLVFVVGSPLFVRGYSYENGIVKCPDESFGIPFNVTELNKYFTKVNRTTLDNYWFATEFEKFTTSCTTGVTDMNQMFWDLGTFNHSISTWDTSSVEDMYEMFNGATSFNQDISNWTTSSVYDMGGMFSGATSFNQSISNWTTSSVEYMDDMFYYATSFNQDISTWITSNVLDMNGMFQGATSFNQDISTWDMSSVNRLDFMFYNATSFNQSLTNWCVNGSFFNGTYTGIHKFTNLNVTFYSTSDFSTHSPMIDAFQPLWNGTGCTSKCFNGIRNTSDYSCTCDPGFYGSSCALTPDITITVTNKDNNAYRFNSSTVDNPTLNLATSTTYYFELGATTMFSHPFVLRDINGAVMGTVLSTGVVLTTDSVAAQYTYKCYSHSAMTGTILSSDPLATESSSSTTTTAEPVTTTTADLVTTSNEPNTTSTPSIEEDSINVNLIIGVVSGGVVLAGLAFFVVYKCFFLEPTSGYTLTTM